MELTEPSRFPDRLGTPTLSEALRRGAWLRPQIRGRMFKDSGSCALGAVYEATFYRSDTDYFSMLEALIGAYPELENEWCEVPGRVRHVLIREIYRRNDRGDTREAIAEWLERMGY